MGGCRGGSASRLEKVTEMEEGEEGPEGNPGLGSA